MTYGARSRPPLLRRALRQRCSAARSGTRHAHARCEARLAGAAAHALRDWRQRAACCEQLGPCRAMDGAVHAAAAQQRLVRRVHDGIALEARQVAQLPRREARRNGC
jgi:hypothetical protein